MKVITLNRKYDDTPETEVLFGINDINNIDEVKFIEKIKKAVRPLTTSERAESYAIEVLNDLKQGRYFGDLNFYVYLYIEEIDIL